MRKAVITVYLAITFSILLSMMLGAIQAAKYSAYRVVCECALQSALFSAFGEYNKELLEQYDLLYIDLSYMTNQVSYKALTDRMESYMNENLKEPEGRLLFANDFFGTGNAHVSMTRCEKASDLFGSNLKKQAVEYTKDFIGADFITDFLSLIRVKKEYELDEESFKKKKEDLDKAAVEAVENANSEKEITEGTKNGNTENDGSETINGKETEDAKTINSFLSIDNLDITYIRPLTAFLLKKNVSTVSGKHFQILDAPSFRLKSNIESSEGAFSETDTDPLADVYFTEYIVRKTGNYVRPKENSYLQYEAEYIYGGRNNDSENLGLVVESIFFIRTAANFISLEQDEEKKEVVDQIAEGISALTEIPAPVVSALIMCIWAAGEASYDVEDLYNGERVELIKNADDFNLSIKGGLKNLLPDHKYKTSGKNELVPVGETEIGNYASEKKDLELSIKLSYEDYLRILIYLMPSSVKSLRMMDIIELDVHITPGNENFRIDWCLNGAEFDVTVKSEFGAEYELKRKYSYSF